ncbi:MAG: hypothetical protein ACRDGD_05660 [Candidatus Limnocylindria bacterium]
MSKVKARDPEVAEEYDFSKAKRGVHYERAMKGARVHIVSDEEDRARKNLSKRRPKAD